MRRRLLVPGVAASAAVIAGVTIMVARHAPPLRWGVQLAAWLVALLLYLALRRRAPAGARGATLLAGVAVLCVAATLVAPGIDGVHRWLRAGPIQIHPSALLVPWLLVHPAASPTPGASLGVPRLALLVVQLLHLAQPDAGQATAVAAGVVTGALAHRPRRASPALLLAAAHVGLAALTWRRPDPLGPAAFVEDILAQAFAVGVPAGVIAVGTLALLAASPLLTGPRDSGFEQEGNAAGAATAGLAAYLAASIMVHAFGEFPVPLLGFGASPIVGTFLGLAALERLRRGGMAARAFTAAQRERRTSLPPVADQPPTSLRPPSDHPPTTPTKKLLASPAPSARLAVVRRRHHEPEEEDRPHWRRQHRR